MRSRGPSAAVLAIALAPCAMAGPAFVDATARSGLNFVGSYGAAWAGIGQQAEMMRRNMGNGAAVGDYDGDGDLDVYLLGQLGLSNQLLRNELDRGLQSFTDVTAIAGVDNLGMSRLAHFADLDNDGDLDLLLINDDDDLDVYPGSRVFRNDGDGTFTDTIASAGFDPVGLLHCGASLGDFDGDGLLDIYVTNWSMELGWGSPQLPGSNQLFLNVGGPPRSREKVSQT